jgi:hypothetical protein
MGEGLIVRRGGAKKPLLTVAPSFNIVSLTSTNLVFSITNNEDSEAVLFYELNNPEPTQNQITLQANQTSSNITFSGLIPSTSYDVYANSTKFGLQTSVTERLNFVTLQPTAPTLTLTNTTTGSIEFTIRNNDTVAALAFYSLSANPTQNEFSINSNQTLSKTILGLDSGTTYTVFARISISGVFSNDVSFTAQTAVPLEATGGTIVGTYTLGGKNYKYHQFNAGGTFTVTNGGVLEYFIAAGGGGSSNASGCGGPGGGGLLTATTTVAAGSYTVVVGAGGAFSTSGAIFVRGGNGGTSSVFGISAVGGAGSSGQTGSTGGSGSGGGGNSDLGSTTNANYGGGGGTAGQGNGGGTGFYRYITSGPNENNTYNLGGGGGGRAAAGGSATVTADGFSPTGGAGGDGLLSSISGTDIYYCGGAAGRVNGNGVSGRAAGLGSGNTPNRGGGTQAGSGGSGVVIIRYEV